MEQHFDWQHSYSRVYPPGEKYSPEGVFMSFAHYNVEVRDRVKCISGVEGNPIIPTCHSVSSASDL